MKLPPVRAKGRFPPPRGYSSGRETRQEDAANWMWSGGPSEALGCVPTPPRGTGRRISGDEWNRRYPVAVVYLYFRTVGAAFRGCSTASSRFSMQIGRAHV